MPEQDWVRVYDANNLESSLRVKIGWMVDSPKRIALYAAKQWFLESPKEFMVYELLVSGYFFRIECTLTPEKEYPMVEGRMIDPSPEQVAACLNLGIRISEDCW